MDGTEGAFGDLFLEYVAADAMDGLIASRRLTSQDPFIKFSRPCCRGHSQGSVQNLAASRVHVERFLAVAAQDQGFHFLTVGDFR